MTQGVFRVSAIALGVASFVSLSPLCPAYADADTSAEPAPTPSLAAPSSASAATPARHSHARHYARRDRAAWPDGRRNPVTEVAGGLADLGAMAAYPVYCFPNYGSCRVYRPY